MKTSHDITLINYYSGELPPYARLFFETCRANPDVHFLIAGSRLPLASDLPNVTFLHITEDELRKRAEQCSGMSVALESHRKICDLKPLYGDIFLDEISEFDFWGYCDIDVAWGNITNFLDSATLSSYDVISTRGDSWLSGACTIFRNEEYFRKLYLKSPSVEKMLSDPEPWIFDENNNRRGQPPLLPIPELVDRNLPVSMLHVVTQAARDGELCLHQPNILRERKPRKYDFTIHWTPTQMIEENWGEILGYHLLFAKDAPFFFIPKDMERVQSIVITPKGVRRGKQSEKAFKAQRIIKGLPRWFRQKTANLQDKVNPRTAVPPEQ
mgnify:CR=1 FL=1